MQTTASKLVSVSLPVSARQQSFRIALEKIKEECQQYTSESASASACTSAPEDETNSASIGLVYADDDITISAPYAQIDSLPCMSETSRGNLLAWDSEESWHSLGEQGRAEADARLRAWYAGKGYAVDLERAEHRRTLACYSFERRVMIGAWMSMMILLGLACWFIARY